MPRAQQSSLKRLGKDASEIFQNTNLGKAPEPEAQSSNSWWLLNPAMFWIEAGCIQVEAASAWTFGDWT